MTREQLIETHSFSKDCRKYYETVKLCFNGIKDLNYSLPTKENEEVEKLEIKVENKVEPGLQKSLTLLEFDINGKNKNNE